ncbi:hypothetical protein INR49_008685 [Caranx melampygus]|nr:hypothetical protein INR49_008685 [Caranx melampygus]
MSSEGQEQCTVLLSERKPLPLVHWSASLVRNTLFGGDGVLQTSSTILHRTLEDPMGVIDFDDGSGSVLRIQPLRTHRDEAIYECTATNSVGQISTSAKLTVLEEDQIPHGFPTIDMGPQLKVIERTRTATMLCAASGHPDPEIYWFKDFLPVDISGSNGRIKQLRSGKAIVSTDLCSQISVLVVQLRKMAQVELG